MLFQQKELKPIQKIIQAVVDWPRPDKMHNLRSFLGLCTYCRRFVKHFSTIARPLHELTEAKSNFDWTDECEKSFNSLKRALTSSPILTYPRSDKDFILDTWLLNFKEPEGQIARWIQRLQEYDFEIQHRKGTSHGKTDALSRRPCQESCKHYMNAEKTFGMETDLSVKVLTTTTEDPWSSCEIQKEQQEIAPKSPATKRCWSLWDSLHLRDCVQYRRWQSDNGSTCRWQLILPKSRIPEVLRQTHDSASGGPFGVMKTLSRARERFYWHRLRADVEKWCRECHACGARKGPKTRTKSRLQRYNVGAPFERMALDILGPFKVSKKVIDTS
ncbi:hypothetical protein AVEN_68741-1 [Araneus ventricosus]|uniref:RNA-directed DNA polymerase n=1 Tax=Araneus ventricosus TaxID=182803 RepID=A0A4Y2C6Q5_ARAVE|nr:hypothetical protein AVEN_68741-1 [Araneus ventricosus]